MPLTETEVQQMRQSVIEAAMEFDEHYLPYMAAAVKAVRNHNGFTSPAENFLLNVLSDYDHKHLTAGTIQQGLDEFKENFESVQSIVAKFAEQFPEQAGKAE